MVCARWNEPRSVAYFVIASVVAAAGYAAVIAIPTAILPNPFFIRMTAPTVWSWVFWILPALLFGPLAASYIVPGMHRTCSLQGKTMAGGILSYLAVGCPICNKIVVAVLGVSGALSYFAPIQPILGALSVALLGYGLWLRFASAERTPQTTAA